MRPERGRSPWRWIALAVLAGVLAAVAVWALTRPDQVLVPSVLNRDEDRARVILEREGFDVRIDAEPSMRPVGEVFGSKGACKIFHCPLHRSKIVAELGC